MKSKLTFFEAISVIAIITISQIVLDFPEYLISITGTGTIANLVELSLIALFFCFLISKFFKNFANQDIIDISALIGGKFLKVFISLIFIAFFLLSASSATFNFLYLIKNIYLDNSGFLFIFGLFLISIFVACIIGFESTKKVATFFFGILVASIICLTLGDNGNFNTNNLIPIFGFNYKTTFLTGAQNIFIFNFIIFYFFLMPIITKKNDFPKIVFSSFAINFALIIISVIAILQYYPTAITEQITNVSSSSIILAVTRRIQITSFLSQTDSIFILFWGYAILCYIVLLLDGIIYILDKNFKYENKQSLSFAIIPIFVGTTLLIPNMTSLHYFENTIFKYFSMFLTFGISFFILILAYFKKSKKVKGNKS